MYLYFIYADKESFSIFLKNCLSLDVSKNRTIIADFDIEDGFNFEDMPLLVVEVDF